ncbi:MAG TPA: hypothetical protein VII73_05830 [Caulobacteraceae bacterium]
MAAPGPFDDVLGDESESAAPEPGLPREDPFAAALALSATTPGAPLDPHTAAYVDEQTRLIRLQVKHYDEERRLAIGAAKRKRFGDRLRNLLVVLVCLATGGAMVGLLAMAWDAAHDHGLIVEAFSVPPDLAQRGLTGQIVARQLLDRLTDLQARTGRTMRAPGSYRNDWGDDLKVEIPQTGVSIGELRGYLRDWLGHEAHITGEVYRTASGLTLTARTGDTASSFSGQDGDLDKLVQQAAEATYAHTQPYRYSVYLGLANRLAEQRAVLGALTGDPDPVERAWAHVGLGNELAGGIDPAGCAVEYHAALREVPGFAPALTNLVDCEVGLGHDQQVLRDAARFLKAQESVHRDIAPDSRERVTAGVRLLRDTTDGDYSDAVAEALHLGERPWLLAYSLVQDHDLGSADIAAAKVGPDNYLHYAPPGLGALELGQPAAASLLNQALSMGPPPFCGCDWVFSRVLRPWLAVAKARFGDAAGAQALLSATPTDCYLCLRARGLVAAAGDDRTQAERWLAEAIAQGADLPQAFTDRGAARLAWGDVAGALSDARRANAVSPRNADALKLWGDALARQGHWRDALPKYDAALNFAPAWAALRRARAIAVGRKG